MLSVVRFRPLWPAGRAEGGLFRFLKASAVNNSVYCRENALKALYNLGDAVSVATPWRL